MHQAELYVQENHSDDTRIPTVHETQGRSEKNDDKTWDKPVNCFDCFRIHMKLEEYKDNRWGEGNYCLYDTISYWYQKAGQEDPYNPVP